MRRIKFVLVTLCLVAVSVPVGPAHATLEPPRLNHSNDHLWLDISLGPPLVSWFNRVAKPDDIARVEQVQQINLLDEVTVGRKLVVFKSVDEAERFMPIIADRIDIIGYNLENGPFNRRTEQTDPIGSVQRMRALADEYGLQLAFGPDHQIAVSDGAAIAPYVDIFVLQVQRVQTDPATVLDFTLPMMRQLHRANPNMEISVQVRTEGDVRDIADLIDRIRAEGLDGVSILTSPETVDVAEDLVTELRARKPPTPAPQVVASASGVEASSSGDASQARMDPNAQATPGTPRQALPWQLPSLVGAFIVGALAGAVGGGLVASLLCASHRQAPGK